jgi:3-methyl-2-oxobutanoate hydroxymethyltransferase
MKIQDFKAYKNEGRKISMVTCYDHWSARIINTTDIDCVLVGDSLAMVMHGHSTTINATTAMMALHTAAVVRGATEKFIVADLPFLSYRKSLTENMNAVEQIMQAGAHALKLEGARGNLELVRHIVDSGVPVMGHLGLTPQSIHQLGGFKVQGRGQKEYLDLVQDAQALEEAGCFSVVLECVPSPLAKEISHTLKIPTIGIGAGSETDGQVLVLHDMLGMNPSFKPKFLRTYLDGFELIKNALNDYHQEVNKKEFPTEKESYL